jgi:ribosome biogenesis SPOUT family RNA methylase Rps3
MHFVIRLVISTTVLNRTGTGLQRAKHTLKVVRIIGGPQVTVGGVISLVWFVTNRGKGLKEINSIFLKEEVKEQEFTTVVADY